MRTTVTISDELLEAARRRARESGQTLGDVIDAALRRDLFEMEAPQAAGRKVPVFRRGTGPRPGIDLSSNSALHEALDAGLPLDTRH